MGKRNQARKRAERIWQQRQARVLEGGRPIPAFPEGFIGGVMWCPQCHAELMRFLDGVEVSQHVQQSIVDAHSC